MKKRMISVMMAAAMGLSLAGCGSKDTAAPADTQAQTTEAEKKDRRPGRRDYGSRIRKS